jgi:hypothetical protein
VGRGKPQSRHATSAGKWIDYPLGVKCYSFNADMFLRAGWLELLDLMSLADFLNLTFAGKYQWGFSCF